jgi:prepilin-type N-terminal cleavage/methylation domain-containing protein/prepilin-type processing-associated H-X9-DG protein
MDRQYYKKMLRKRAFTLLEVLIVVVIMSALLLIMFPAIRSIQNSARSGKCLSQLRQIMTGTLLYALDSSDQFPRSQHSAYTFGQLPWGRAISGNLYCGCGCSGVSTTSESWQQIFNGLYRCPADLRKEQWSYGLNVYFELGEDDDYVGKPATWRKITDVPSPSATIVYAEISNSVDHLMAHFWESDDETEVDSDRHLSTSNYVYTDGHADAQNFKKTFNLQQKVNHWNPGLN